MKNNIIRKLAVLYSLGLGGCVSAEGLEKLVINKMILDPSQTSVQSDYDSLNLSIAPVFSYNLYSMNSLEGDINLFYPVYSNEIINGSDGKDENEKEIFHIPKIPLIFYESRYSGGEGLIFEYGNADFLRNPNLDYLERDGFDLNVGYFSNPTFVINFKKNIQRGIKDFISKNDEIGIGGVDTKVSIKGLQFRSGNKIFRLGKAIEFEYKGSNNHFIGICGVELSGVPDRDYLFECKLRFWW